MYKTVSDLSYLNDLLVNFFEQKYIQRQLSKIYDLDISGWEIWFQVELYIFLTEQKEKKVINDVLREQRYELDQRKSYTQRTGKKYCAIDIEIMKRNAKANEKWIPIEIKQAVRVETCLNNILLDLDKYDAIKSSEKYAGNFRSPFFIGVVKSISNDEKENIAKIKETLEAYEITKNNRIIAIPNTNFSVIIF